MAVKRQADNIQIVVCEMMSCRLVETNSHHVERVPLSAGYNLIVYVKGRIAAIGQTYKCSCFSCIRWKA